MGNKLKCKFCGNIWITNSVKDKVTCTNCLNKIPQKECKIK